MYAFDYKRPASLADAKGAVSGDARFLAGGQSLIQAMKLRLSQSSTLVDLGGVPDLKGITVDGSSVTVGAMATHAAVAASADVRRVLPALAELAGGIGDPMVRNMGTIGGSIANADPAACYPAAVLGLGAMVRTNQRTIQGDAFFTGLFETALGPHDVLSAVRMPAAGADTRVGFAELARRHGDYAIVGLAAAAKASGKGLADVRLCYFGVDATPVRAGKAEAALMRGSVDEAVKALDLDPPDDIQATGAVKKHLAGVLLRRVAKQLAEPRA